MKSSKNDEIDNLKSDQLYFNIFIWQKVPHLFFNELSLGMTGEEIFSFS